MVPGISRFVPYFLNVISLWPTKIYRTIVVWYVWPTMSLYHAIMRVEYNVGVLCCITTHKDDTHGRRVVDVVLGQA